MIAAREDPEPCSRTFADRRAGEAGAMPRDLQALIAGAVGGAIGTGTMSAVLVVAKALGLLGEPPPKLIVAAVLEAVGARRRTETTEEALAVVAHFGFGMGAGSLFALLLRRLRLPLAPAWQGVVFGSLVWVVSYKGWVPALGAMPPPERDRPGRPIAMLLAHGVFGLTLGIIVGRSKRSSR